MPSGMLPKPPNLAKAFTVQRPKRLRNTLISVLICAGLMIAYYISIGQTPIAPNTRIVYEAQDCGGSCQVFRLEINADGAVVLTDPHHVWRYKIAKFALRRMLRAFDRVQFLTRNVNGYLPRHPPVCVLSLAENHIMLALRHACGAATSELAVPVDAIEQATQFRTILQGKADVLRRYYVSRDR